MITDLAGIAPNVNVRDSNGGVTTNVTIRGIGLQDFSVNNSPTIGMYIDDVFLPSTALLNGRIFDVERVEVLKGPQGTLYGRNTTGGLINFISKKPTDEREIMINTSIGNYETYDTNLVINGPLSDSLNARLAVQSHRRNEGFFTNRLDGNDLGKEDVLSGRLTVQWLVNDDWDISVKLESSDTYSQPRPFVHFGTLDPNSGSTCAPIANGRRSNACVDALGYADTDNDPYTGDWNRDERLDSDQLGGVIVVNGQLEIGDLTSVTAYSEFNRSYVADPDASPATALESNPFDDMHQFSQELRLAGSHGMVDWIVGVFYSTDSVSSESVANLTDLLGIVTKGAIDQTTDSAAVFVHTDWNITESTSVNVGVRYTEEEKEFEGGNTISTPGGFFPLYPAVEHDILEEKISWKLGVEHETENDTLFYASVSEGFKSGGFFGGTFTTNPGQYDPYDPETLLAYEVGFKSRLLDNTLQLNGAAFFYDYSDIQIFVQESIGTVIFSKLDNVEEAEVMGIELDALWRAAQGLDISASLGWLDTELGAFTTTNGDIAPGNKLANSPEWTFNTQVIYEIPINEKLLIETRVGANFTDFIYKEPQNLGFLSTDSYWLYNARVALKESSGQWEVALIGNNLSDEIVESHIFDNGVGNGGITVGAPRTYAVSFTYFIN